MKSEILQFVFYLIALVVGGAVEAVWPRMLGVGAPILLALSVALASRRLPIAMVLMALAAGAFEDSLSSLPMMTSPCFFLVAALLVWRTRFAKSVMVASYPLYQVWLGAIVPDVEGSMATRFLVAIPMAALMAFAILPLFAWLEGKAAIHET